MLMRLEVTTVPTIKWLAKMAPSVVALSPAATDATAAKAASDGANRVAPTALSTVAVRLAVPTADTSEVSPAAVAVAEIETGTLQ